MWPLGPPWRARQYGAMTDESPIDGVLSSRPAQATWGVDGYPEPSSRHQHNKY